jgi:hypothetical protein
MKGQSLIIQFILFFVIGLSIFAAIGSLFKFQAKLYQQQIADESRKQLANFFGSIIVYQNSCQCNSRYEVGFKNLTAGYITQFLLDDRGLIVIMIPGGKYYLFPLYNLGKSYEVGGAAYSTRPIKITFSKTQNKIEVVQ